MKKFTTKEILESGKIYGNATKEEIEQAEILLNHPELMLAYLEETHE